ncbi:MAG: glycosyltransferase family 39 protein [Candidatus Micrarchaeota archaeon]
MKLNWTFSSEGEKVAIISFTLIAILVFLAGFSRLSWDGAISGGDDLAMYNEAQTRNSLEKIFDPFFKQATIHTQTHYMPLDIMEWGLFARFFGTGAFGYHVVIFLFHIAAAVLLFFVLRKMEYGRWAAYVGSVLFFIFPLHINTLNWIASGTRHPLAAIFLLLTLFFFLNFLSKKKLRYYLLTFLLFVLGSLFIEAFYLFVILMVYEFWIFKENSESKKPDWKNLKKYVPFVLAGIFFFLLNAVRFGESLIARFNGGLPLTPVVFFRLGDFIKEIFWPFLVSDFLFKAILIFAVFLLGLAVLALEKQKMPKFWVFWIVCIGIMAVAVNLRPLPETIRYTYVLSIGCFAIIAHYFDRPNIFFKLVPVALGAIYLLSM